MVEADLHGGAVDRRPDRNDVLAGGGPDAQEGAGKATALHLSEHEPAELERIICRRSPGQALVQRACSVRGCAEPGATSAGVARALGVRHPSVTTWRARFAADRPGGLADAPRSGAPRRVGDDEVERLITFTLETQPEGATHWPTRATAKRLGMSQTMVSQAWRACGLQPHQAETLKLSSDPAFIARARDVVGLYMAPPERALVLCVNGSEPANATGSRAQASADPGGRTQRTRAADATGAPQA